MLPRPARLTRSSGFGAAVRQGRRAGTKLVVVHLSEDAGRDRGAAPAVCGFVVSRAVGPAAIRNRVKRRLRHLVAARLDELPRGGTLVVRALPAAAGASYAELERALDRALARVLSPSVDGVQA